MLGNRVRTIPKEGERIERIYKLGGNLGVLYSYKFFLRFYPIIIVDLPPVMTMKRSNLISVIIDFNHINETSAQLF